MQLPESSGNSGSVTATAPRSINSRSMILVRTRRSQPGQRRSSSFSSSRWRLTSTGIRYASERSASSVGTTRIACASTRSVVGGTSRITDCTPNACATPSRNSALTAIQQRRLVAVALGQRLERRGMVGVDLRPVDPAEAGDHRVVLARAVERAERAAVLAREAERVRVDRVVPGHSHPARPAPAPSGSCRSPPGTRRAGRPPATQAGRRRAVARTPRACRQVLAPISSSSSSASSSAPVRSLGTISMKRSRAR